MSGYAIMRFVKHSGSASGIEAHHERLKDNYKSNPDIRTERSARNIHLIQSEMRYSREIKARIEAARERNPKIIVKTNSVRFVDTLITATPSYFEGFSMEVVKRYFQTALKFFEEKVSAKNIVSAVIHMDENTPHMHLVFVPLTDDDRLSAKDIIGGPGGCRKWQDEFYQSMAKSFPGLMRGRSAELTGRKHIETKEYKEIVRAESSLENRMNMATELKTLRRYTNSIPETIKQDIREAHKQARLEESKQEHERLR